MSDNKVLPIVRFNNFKNSWEKFTLNEVLKINSGKDYKHLKVGNIPVYGTGGYMLSVNDKLSDKDAIGIGRKGTINKPQLLKAPFWTVDTLFFIHPLNKNDYYFVFSIMNKINWKKYDESTGVPSLSKATIEKIIVFFPHSEEQIEIGKFFRKLDQTIVLQQQLLNDHKQLKKAMLHKMFPQKGESVPRVRFTGFTGNWKKHKLGDYLTIPEKNEKKITNLDELITLKLNLLGMYSGSNRATLELGSTKYYERKAGQFLYGKQNFFNGSMGIIPDELDGKATSGDVPAFDINDINRDYIFTYVSRPSYWKSKESQSSGTGSKRIHEKVLQNFDINVPSSEEQTKIGNFFKQLEETIILHEKKLATYQNLKKAMLQKMFV